MMSAFNDKNKLLGLGAILVYAALAILGGLKSELYVLTYMLLPSCYVYLYVNFGKKLGLGLGVILALLSMSVGGLNSLVYGALYALLGYAIYYIMGLEGKQFKKFSLVIFICMLLLIGGFVVLDVATGGPSILEEINLLLKNAEFMKQLGDALAKSNPGLMGIEGIEGLIVDQNMLKLAISTLLPLFLFLTAMSIAIVNYPMINREVRKLDRTIEPIAPLWGLYVPYPLVFSLVLIGMIGMMTNVDTGFGGGLFITAFLLNTTFFVMQGLFLLAFVMQAYGLNPKYITPICLIIFVVSLFLGLGLVFTLLLYAGLIDLIFDIRRLRRRGRG